MITDIIKNSILHTAKSVQVTEFDDVSYGGRCPFDEEEMSNFYGNSEINRANDHSINHASAVVDFAVCVETAHFDFYDKEVLQGKGEAKSSTSMVAEEEELR